MICLTHVVEPANASQQLAALRNKNIVTARKETDTSARW